MKAARRALTTAILVWSFSSAARAIESDGQLWATGRINHPVSESFSLSFLAQGRFADDIGTTQAWLLRPALHYQLWEAVWLSAGYDYLRFVGVTEENRFWQQVGLPLRFGGLVLGNRLRIEQRWIGGISGVVARLRYRIRSAHPIGDSPFYLVFTNELYLNLNGVAPGPKQGFEQNFLGGGLGLHLGPYVRAEVGYLWRYLSTRSFERQDHLLVLNLFIETRGKAEAAPVKDEGHH